ncbi:MAG: S9 family peptidase [Chloroflexi bacterium]|nr:S9 family peptidase [Chloroflexota bacterium]
MSSRRLLAPADIRRQVVVEELDLSTDARLAVVVRRAIRGNRYVGHLYAIPLDRGRVATPRRLTSGLVRDTYPRLSPDGRQVAFVRTDPTDDDATAALVILDLRSGRQRTLPARGHGSVAEIAWSPGGRRLAFSAEVDPPRFLVGDVPPVGGHDRPRRGGAASTRAPSPLARRITRADWRWDGSGHLDRWSHLFVVEVRAGARPRQVTSGDWGVADLCWAPDGRTVAFTADPGPDADTHPRPGIWAVDVDGAGPPRPVLVPAGFANHAAFSPDGRWLAAVGVLDADPLDDVSPGILLGPADGSAPPRALAPELDRPIGNWTDTDLNGWMVSGRPGPYWLDPGTIVATVSDRGRSHPVRFRLDPRTGAAIDPPAPTPRGGTGPWSDATSHTLAVTRTGTIAVLGTLGTRAMELMTPDADAAGRPRWTTRSTLGSAWQRRFVQPEMRRLDAPGSAGPIETWVASPPDAGDTALPAVVDIHGGPLGAWAPAPHVEVALLVARGYRVILPNIRGSTSYGRDWIRPQLGDWGGVDAADLHAALDHVIALGLVDPDRLGALGLSYGGFMVNWLVGTTDRFRAAVSENGVTNQISGWANSDSGPEYDRASLIGDPFTPAGIERLWRQSPLRHVAAIRTPLLMFQAEADLRCPPQDNEQLFIALRHLGRTVEYVLYPDESHVYSSSGRPDRRIDRMTRMLDWFDRYLRA